MEYDAVFLYRGDIRYDTRLGNFVSMYISRGKRVVVIQGSLKNESFDYEGAHIISFKNQETGPKGFFYYWMRSARIVSSIRAKVYWANDLYSLPLAIWVARKYGSRAAYDSREMYAHIGALRKSTVKQKFWHGLEKFLLRAAPAVVTSGQMDSEYLVDRYGIEFPHVVRNVPRFRHIERNDRIREELHIGATVPVCLYIGGFQEGRGIPLMLQLAEVIPECAFVFIGNGLFEPIVNAAMTRQKNVYHIPTVPNAAVISYAASATLGCALIEPITLSYYLALPNKLFEYIMAGTPVVATFVPQIEKIILEYGVGEIVPYNDLETTAASIRRLLEDKTLYDQCAHNCHNAANVLCWEREEAGFAVFAQAKGLL